MRLEPASIVEDSPESGGLVDVDLAGLLGISLAELLAVLEALETAHKHASLAGEVRGTVQTKAAGKVELGRVQQLAVGVVAEVDGLALPLRLELGRSTVRERSKRRAEVLEHLEVLVLAAGGNDAARWLRRGTRTAAASRRSSNSKGRNQSAGGRSCSRVGSTAGANWSRSLWLGDAAGASIKDPISALRSGWLGCNWLGWLDSRQTTSSNGGIAIGLEIGSLVLQPGSGVAVEVLQDLRLDGDHQVVVLTAWRRDNSEDVGRGLEGPDMVIDDLHVSVFILDRCKQGRLGQARWRRLVNGIQNGILDGRALRRAWSVVGVAGIAGGILGVGRDGRRHGQRQLVRHRGSAAAVCRHGGEDRSHFIERL